jgi:hypothetical protein
MSLRSWRTPHRRDREVDTDDRLGPYDLESTLPVEDDVVGIQCVEGNGQATRIGPLGARFEQLRGDAAASVIGEHADAVEIDVAIRPGASMHQPDQPVTFLQSLLGVGREGRRRRWCDGGCWEHLLDRRTFQPDGYADDRVTPGIDPPLVHGLVHGLDEEAFVHLQELVVVGEQPAASRLIEHRASQDRCGFGDTIRWHGDDGHGPTIRGAWGTGRR